MNHTSQAILNLQERVEKLEAILSALGVDVTEDKGKKSGSDRSATSMENLVAARPMHEVWLTAVEVGDRMGQSSSWVRQHAAMLPASARRQKKNGRRTWYYLWNDNTEQLFNNIKIL